MESHLSGDSTSAVIGSAVQNREKWRRGLGTALHNAPSRIYEQLAQ
jgi:hypothetical protein